MRNPELALLAAGCGPPAEAPARVAEALRAPIDWRLLVERSNAQGTLLLLSGILGTKAANGVPREFLAEIGEKAARKTFRSLVMASELAHVMRNFETAGLSAITFKGPTLAHLAYGDMALRDSADLDIYIPRPQLKTALNLLYSDGYQEMSPAFRTSLAGGCEVALRRHNPACDIDLHWQFSPPYFLQFDAVRAFRRSVIVRASGLVARTLCTEDLLMYLCIHAARECWAIRSICDVTALVTNQRIDWDDLLRETLRARCWRAVAVGLRLAASILDAPVPQEIRRRVDRDRDVCAVASELAKYLTGEIADHAGTPAGAMLHLRMLDTPRARARYLWRRALQPNHLDASFVRLPESLEPAYYLVRPLRVAWTALGRRRQQSAAPPLTTR
jgi:hypothetical protein